MVTQVEIDEYERFSVADMLTLEIALRMEGNIPIFLWLKLFVLSLSFLSLILSDNNITLCCKRCESCGAEQILDIRKCSVGGIG